MFKEKIKPLYRGYKLEINLSKFGYKSYILECSYFYDKSKNMYCLSMYLNKKDIQDKLRISYKNINTQYISGTRETIVENVCEVVNQMCASDFFEDYIAKYEYDLMCFDKGDEILEEERLNKKHANKE